MNAPPPAANDSAAALEGLGRITQEIDSANPSPEDMERQERELQEAAELEQGAKEWALLMFTVGSAVTMIAPELRQVYTQEACLHWGQCAHAVGKKYGWNAPAAPEIALAGATFGMVVPTVFAIRHRMQMLKEGKEAGLFGKLVMWWRERRAAKAAAATAKDGDGGQGGGQQ